MIGNPNSESDTWHARAHNIRRNYTSIALEGLRAQHYAAVFHRVQNAKHPTYLAPFKLDGFERDLEIKFTYVRKCNGRAHTIGLLSGLRIAEPHKRFNFCRDVEGSHLFRGTIDLPGARLIIGILPAQSADGSKIYVCHLEVVRDHA